MKEFYELQAGIWRPQSEEFFTKKLHGVIAEARQSGAHPVVPREITASSLQTLAVAVTPPCIDTALLPRQDRLRNFHLDTGEVLPGSAFANGVLTMTADGGVQLLGRHSRHFFSNAQPYAFPDKTPIRPEVFDAWLADRLPCEDTRTAFWEVQGATVAQELHAQQRIVALTGPGRSSKGTALKVASMLVGKMHTATFTGGPARMGKSQFSLSELYAAALVLLPDMPPPPRYESIRREQYMEGLSYLKSIAGGDPILIERKNKDPITAHIDASLWIDSNFGSSGYIQGREDSYSWEERLITIPFLKSLTEEERVNRFEENFRDECRGSLGMLSMLMLEPSAEGTLHGLRKWCWSISSCLRGKPCSREILQTTTSQRWPVDQ